MGRIIELHFHDNCPRCSCSISNIDKVIGVTPK
jgi:hypothetical protein